MAKNREVLQLHIGQAGVQIASACWELYCLEHGICLDGTFRETYYGNDFNAFFHCNELCQCVPRLVMADLEPTPIDEIRTGCYRNLFHPLSLVSGKEDAASCFARGYCDLGHELIDLTMDRIRKVIEECSSPQGIIMFRAVGGGTGSGFGTLLLEQMSNEYGKMCKLEFVVFPSPRISPIIVEPYNSVLATHAGLDYADVSFLFDNEACYEVCGRNLDICKPTYTNLNRLIGQVVSSATASLRFDGAINVDLLEFATNLVPYPRIHFPLLAYAPLLPFAYSELETLTISKITDYCFDINYQLSKCDPQAGKYMSCCMLYRGDIYPNDVNGAVKTIKERDSIQFVDWSPSGIKIGINYQPPTFVPGSNIAPVNRAVCMLANTTSIRAPLQRILKKFATLYEKKTFLHHYLDEGLEETCFNDAAENIKALVLAYKEVET